MSRRAGHMPLFREVAAGRMTPAEAAERITPRRHLCGALAYVIAAVSLFVLFLSLSGCCTLPDPPPVVVSGCTLTDPPPPLPALTWVACPGYDACLSTADAVRLAVWHREIRLWAAVAWEKCRAPVHQAKNVLTP